MTGHVLHIITGLDTGGAERSLFNLLASDFATDLTHSVISLGGMGHFGPLLQERGIAVHAFDMLNGAGLLRAPVRLGRLMRQTRPDIVQGWMPHGNVIATIAASMSPRPVDLAWNVRQSLYDLRAEKRATQWMIRGLKRLSGRPNRIIYNSYQARDHHEALGFSSLRGIVIPNGFDTARWRPDAPRRAAFRSAIGVGEDAPVAGFVGRFDPLKDVPTFMAACATALAEHPQLQVVMVGEGLTPDNSALAPLFQKMPSQRFHALGRRADIEAILPAMDFFCLSSVSEAFPNVIGEAMASGLPCIATDVGDCARLLDGHGRIVPPRDSGKMAEAMVEMVQIGVAQRTEIGAAARARIEEYYSLSATVDAYTKLYDSMMKREV